MIRGISFQNGIFFIGKNHVACAYQEKGRIKDWIKPLDANTVMLMAKYIFFTMPLSYKLLTLVVIALIFIPKLTSAIAWEGLPYFAVFYFSFGTHFIFPTRLKKYHGAEHKVFSDRGIKRRSRINQIKKAVITNRHCSTNLVVMYFHLVIVGTVVLFSFLPFVDALMWASYGSVLIAPILTKSLKYKSLTFLRKYILGLSYYLQKKVTTTEPDRHHLVTAVQSYRRLALVEFPHVLRERVVKKKEEKKLAIVDVTIIPIGTNSPSVSDYVADIQSVLESYSDRISYRLTPMSTIIEGELAVLFEVIQAIHEVPFHAGVQRVATNIRIDDRRDKAQTMDSKVAAVEEKLLAKKTVLSDESEQIIQKEQ
ncbi:MTH1187 family thiamine-binding protein [Bacillus alkalicellulosilyticus]|uniref:MTH1187 family thiamine-binding protein n=1 Tax=Alkalihalobacterium alkalicellulosilyticum TaxID=1912214 RepID=UPI000998E4A7|nr:MTH1187 family thiamine-binding protein [Bacillus alkalicellulosilyticus]